MEKFIGDAVMALFGVPLSHEDDPSRALRCALSMQHRLGRLNERLEDAARRAVQAANRGQHRRGPGFDRTGRRSGDDHRGCRERGRRLEQSAESGQIVRGRADRTPGPWLPVRRPRPAGPQGEGRCRSGPTCSLRKPQEGHRSRPNAASPASSAPMVGRDAELALVRAIVDRCESEGHPHLVTVYGEAGVGKSRLVRELVEWAEHRAEPPLVLRGRCLPYGDGVTYWPLAEILKGLAGVFDSDPAATSWRSCGRMGEALAGAAIPMPTWIGWWTVWRPRSGIIEPGSSLADVSPRLLRTEIHAAWRGLLTQLASGSPVLAVIEDIHWADPALLDLVEELAERCAGALVLICPSRPDLTAHRPGLGRGAAQRVGDRAWIRSRWPMPGGWRRSCSTSTTCPTSSGRGSWSEPKATRSSSRRSCASSSTRGASCAKASVGGPRPMSPTSASRIRCNPCWRPASTCSPLSSKRMLQTRRGRRTSVLDGLARRADRRQPGRAARHPRRARSHHHQDRFRLPGRAGVHLSPRAHVRCRVRLDPSTATGGSCTPRSEPGSRMSRGAGRVSSPSCWPTTGARPSPARDPTSKRGRAEIERRRSLAYRWCLTAAGDAHRRGIAERARSFAQHALDLAVSPDERADAAAALGEAHQLMGDGSPALAAFPRRGRCAHRCGSTRSDPRRVPVPRLTEIPVRWVGSLREPADHAGGLWDYIERGLRPSPAMVTARRGRGC